MAEAYALKKNKKKIIKKKQENSNKKRKKKLGYSRTGMQGLLRE